MAAALTWTNYTLVRIPRGNPSEVEVIARRTLRESLGTWPDRAVQLAREYSMGSGVEVRRSNVFGIRFVLVAVRG